MLLWRLGSRRGDERKRVALIDYFSEGIPGKIHFQVCKYNRNEIC